SAAQLCLFVFFSSSERSSAENLFIQPILSFIQPIFSFGIAAAVDSFPPSLHPELF
ncbi:hypothetical protein LINGRAPRIM_LOCUS3410, partial [Linum grandiflorum]